MTEFLLRFEDSEPSLRSTQVVELDSLDEAVANVTVSLREIVADHLRHDKVLTMDSIAILDEKHQVLATVTIGDILWDRLVGARPFLKDPSTKNDTSRSA